MGRNPLQGGQVGRSGIRTIGTHLQGPERMLAQRDGASSVRARKALSAFMSVDHLIPKAFGAAELQTVCRAH